MSIEIIKEGNIKDLRWRFECDCGCVWVAGIAEYRSEGAVRQCSKVESYCPACERTHRVPFQDGVVEEAMRKEPEHEEVSAMQTQRINPTPWRAFAISTTAGAFWCLVAVFWLGMNAWWAVGLSALSALAAFRGLRWGR